MALERPRVLFLCAHNAARSQLAEALLRHLARDRFEASSAGLDPTAVHPIALEVLSEARVDVHGLRAKSVREFLGNRGVRYAIVLSQEPDGSCPRIYPFATQTLRWPVPDPTTADDAQARDRFRAVRDEIDARLRHWLAEIDVPAVLAS
jgi:arsenate reductase